MEIQYNHDRKAFLVIDEGIELAIVPFPYIDTNQQGNVFAKENVDNYSFSIYYRKDVPELGYHQVKVKMGGGNSQRIGWMIPFATLTTEDDDTLRKPYLNEFAFWAYCYLLSSENIQKEIIRSDDEIVSFDFILSHFYPDGNLFIIENNQMPVGMTEKNYELSLARNGYYKNKVEYLNPKIQLDLGANLILSPCSEILRTEGAYVNDYIEEFLVHHAYVDNSFIRFFYLYQIVEVLLDAEMVELLRDFATKIENNQATFRTADKALQSNTESTRFKRVVESAGLVVGSYASLDSACNNFLGSAPDGQLVNPESIYQVRNHIVHRFRKAVADEVTVKDICDHLELYLYDLLIKYKLPDVNRGVI